jgi:hypothetical protein
LTLKTITEYCVYICFKEKDRIHTSGKLHCKMTAEFKHKKIQD